MSVHLAKRSACDRCREHKVRCLRGEQSNQACARCQRAGASCNTSSARPLGRPRTAFASSKVRDRNHSRSSHNASSCSRQQPNSMQPQERSVSQTENAPLWAEVDENQGLFSNTRPDNSFLDGLVSTSSWPRVEEYPLFELPLGEEDDTSLGSTPSLQDGKCGYVPSHTGRTTISLTHSSAVGE
jgi:hypothetical protein